MMKQKPKGKVIDFHMIEEGWSLYRLEDGNFLRVKLIMVKVVKTEQVKSDGTPNYVFQSTNAVAVFTPQEMVSMRPKARDIT